MLPSEFSDKMAAHVSIAPYFKVPDEKWAEFKSGFAPFYEKTRNGTMKNGQCLYYGFAIHGNTIYCREGYKDAKSEREF